MPKMDFGDALPIWEEFKRTGNVDLRNQLVKIYLPLTAFHASVIRKKLPDYLVIETDDLASEGVFGLFDAIDDFDLARNVKFETYSQPRIRGSILDFLREEDFVSRVMRVRARKYEEVVVALGNGDGNSHLPTVQEIADYHEVPLDEAGRILENGTRRKVRFIPIVPMPRGEDNVTSHNRQGIIAVDELPDTRSDRPDQGLFTDDDGFLEMIDSLSLTERIIMRLYYQEGMGFIDIGAILRISESRASQMHSEALDQIKRRMEDHGHNGERSFT